MGGLVGLLVVSSFTVNGTPVGGCFWICNPGYNFTYCCAVVLIWFDIVKRDLLSFAIIFCVRVSPRFAYQLTILGNLWKASKFIPIVLPSLPKWILAIVVKYYIQADVKVFRSCQTMFDFFYFLPNILHRIIRLYRIIESITPNYKASRWVCGVFNIRPTKIVKFNTNWKCFTLGEQFTIVSTFSLHYNQIANRDPAKICFYIFHFHEFLSKFNAF